MKQLHKSVFVLRHSAGSAAVERLRSGIRGQPQRPALPGRMRPTPTPNPALPSTIRRIGTPRATGI